MSTPGARGRERHVRGLDAWLAGTAPSSVRGEVSLALVGDARMRSLNRRFRGVDRATDVLSFPADPLPARPPAPQPATISGLPFVGDIVIAWGLAERQARAAGHSLQTELRVLALHGLLHLAGYDHERAADRGRMRRVEERLRRKGGLAAGLIGRSVQSEPDATRVNALNPAHRSAFSPAGTQAGPTETNAPATSRRRGISQRRKPDATGPK